MNSLISCRLGTGGRSAACASSSSEASSLARATLRTVAVEKSVMVDGDGRGVFSAAPSKSDDLMVCHGFAYQYVRINFNSYITNLIQI